MQNNFIATTLTITHGINDNMKNNFFTDYSDYADFQYQIRINFITDYADFADFREYIKITWPVTTLILKTT